MPRTVKEWIGATADSPIPNRVRVRVIEKFGGVCQGTCHRPTWAYKGLDIDHTIALALWIATPEAPHGNRESNLRPLCRDVCHPAKTELDKAAKALTYRLKKIRYGIKKEGHFARLRAWRDRILAERKAVEE